MGEKKGAFILWSVKYTESIITGIKSHNVTAIKDGNKQSSSWGFKFNTSILKVILLFKKVQYITF